MNTTAVARPLSGPGLVARYGDLFLVCADDGPGVEDLLGLIAEVAAASGDGGVLVRRVAAVLAADFEGRFPACAASGPAADGRLAVLVYGAATADVVGGEGEITLSGTDAITSVNRLVAGPVTVIRLQLPGAGAANPRSRLDAGIVSAAGVVYSDPGAAAPVSPVARPFTMDPPRAPERVWTPEPESAPEPAVREPWAPEPVPPQRIVAEPVPPEPAPWTPEPAPWTPAPAPWTPAPAPWAKEPESWTPEPVPPPVYSAPEPMVAAPPVPPPVTDEPPVPPPVTDAPPVPLPLMEEPLPEAMVPPPPPPIVEPEPPPLRQPDPSAPFVAVLLVGEGAAAGEPPTPVVDMRPRVLGVLCKNDHFNDPNLRYCAVCGISMAQQTLVKQEGPRPPLGVLLLDDGMTFRLDVDYVVGREPQHDPEVVAGTVRPLRVTDAEGVVSRRHVRVALVGWDVQVVDLGSANGTYLQLPGEPQRHQLVANQPVVVQPGSQVTIGRRWLRYESHRNP